MLLAVKVGAFRSAAIRVAGDAEAFGLPALIDSGDSGGDFTVLKRIGCRAMRSGNTSPEPGTESARYWGETDAAQCRHANGADAAALQEYPDWITASCSDGYSETAPVGSFTPNAFGLYDTLGNVWEWTLDCWNERYSGAPVDGSAWASGDCTDRVSRGGSWQNVAGRLRSGQPCPEFCGGVLEPLRRLSRGPNHQLSKWAIKREFTWRRVPWE